MQKQAITNSATSTWLREQSNLIWENVVTKGLWRRMLKVVVATTTANAIMLIPQVEPAIGKASYLAGIVTAFGHPGRRFGQLVEALVLAVVRIPNETFPFLSYCLPASSRVGTKYATCAVMCSPCVRRPNVLEIWAFLFL